MEKWLCWSALGVGGVLLLLFLLDLILSIAHVPFLPFGGISPTIDVIVVLACGILLYISWDAYKDVR